MTKSADAFRTISEVSLLLDTPTHVLRFWESRFPQVKPLKRAGGRRYYRPGDVALLAGIKQLLHEDGLTIRGVQKILKEQGTSAVAARATIAFEDAPPAQIYTFPSPPEAAQVITPVEEIVPEAPFAIAEPDPIRAEIVAFAVISPVADTAVPVAPLQQLQAALQGLNPGDFSTVERIRLLALRDRMIALRDRMSAPAGAVQR
ncbi:MAG TPA: MerR family transcriptional regulator [Paenirhodobacter sp.]